MAKHPRILVGQVAAVTGAARGIGRATAQAFAREGMKVAIGDLEAELAEQAAAEIGPNACGFELDVTRRDSFEAFVDAAEERFGPLDVLVNNAGIMPLGRFVDEDEATAVRMVDINVHGVIHGMKIALPRMMARDRGHVVNIASQAGKAGLPGGATYCATKHAVVGLSEAVRAELRDTAIDVSVVMPAVVNTELGSGLPDTPGIKKLEPQEVAEAIVKALQFPKFDVWVPASSAVIDKLIHPLPRRAREVIGRLLKADKVLAEPDRAQRAAYEDRAARSEPGLEPESGKGAGAKPAEAAEEKSPVTR
jgi:NADP-dependent 3-hydroxy acid dehydrogenase YdfG